MPFIKDPQYSPAEALERYASRPNINFYPQEFIRHLIVYELIAQGKPNEAMALKTLAARILGHQRSYKVFKLGLLSDETRFDKQGFIKDPAFKISKELATFIFKEELAKHVDIYDPELKSISVKLLDKIQKNADDRIERILDGEEPVPKSYFNEYRPSISRLNSIIKFNTDHISTEEMDAVLGIDTILYDIFYLKYDNKGQFKPARIVKIVDKFGREVPFNSIFDIEEQFVIFRPQGYFKYTRLVKNYNRFTPIVRRFPDWNAIIAHINSGNWLRQNETFRSFFHEDTFVYNFIVRVMNMIFQYCLTMADVPFDHNIISSLNWLFGCHTSAIPPSIGRFDFFGPLSQEEIEMFEDGTKMWRIKIAQKMPKGTYVNSDNQNDKYIPQYIRGESYDPETKAFLKRGKTPENNDDIEVYKGEGTMYYMTDAAAAVTRSYIRDYLYAADSFEEIKRSRK